MKLKEEAEKQYSDAANREAAKERARSKRDKNENAAWGKASLLCQSDISKISNDHLKRHLAARNESIEGNKKTLIERLAKSVEDEVQLEVTLALEAEHCKIRDLEQKGSIYVAGNNDQGQLGLGDRDDRHVFTVVPKLRGKECRHVSAYGSVCIATTQASEVYSWGGRGVNPILLTEDESLVAPQRMAALDGEEIVMTAGGSTHACSISRSGDLFVWGKLLVLEDTRSRPEYMDKFTVKAIACGAKHICAVSNDGELYTWGGGPCIGESFQAVPMQLKIAEPVKMIACGSQHTIAATESRLFSWGCGDGYRLGHGDFLEKNSPCEITSITELGRSVILDVSAGTWHSACILSNDSSTNGALYTWGSGYCGQLGLGTQCAAASPTKVELKDVKKVICGSTHNAAITHDDSLYTWGSNAHGQLGRSIEETDVCFTSFPGIVEFGTIVDRIGRGVPKSVACGYDFTVVACYPYTGPSEEEMMALLEIERRKEQEENDEKARLQREMEEQEARQEEAETEKKKIRYLTSKRLCTMDATCPGFTYEPSTPSICRECGYSVAFHTITVDEAESASNNNK